MRSGDVGEKNQVGKSEVGQSQQSRRFAVYPEPKPKARARARAKRRVPRIGWTVLTVPAREALAQQWLVNQQPENHPDQEKFHDGRIWTIRDSLDLENPSPGLLMSCPVEDSTISSSQGHIVRWLDGLGDKHRKSIITYRA